MKRIPLSRINELFDKISASEKLYMPVKKAGVTNFSLYAEGDTFDPAVLNTVKSAKDLFFPQCEDVVSFETENGNLNITEAELCSEHFVAFGLRACDVKGLDVLDKVFLSEPCDKFYACRRENGTIVALACYNPDEACFCRTFGIDPFAPKGDVIVKIADEYLFWEPVTSKGVALTAKVEDMFDDSDDCITLEYEKRAELTYASLPLSSLTLDGFGQGKTKELFERDEWKNLSASCIGCGTCTFVCPTCQCYDVKDYKTSSGVKRYRCWDSCMYNDFTMMAHGTPRPLKFQRFRQRFMHKLVYFPDNNNGEYSCVGCGRCLRKCPVSMNIVKVMKVLGGIKNV